MPISEEVFPLDIRSRSCVVWAMDQDWAVAENHADYARDDGNLYLTAREYWKGERRIALLDSMCGRGIRICTARVIYSNVLVVSPKRRP